METDNMTRQQYFSYKRNSNFYYLRLVNEKILEKY
jgi:hypothetical protein